MQKPYFQITAETKLTDEDFVIIQAQQKAEVFNAGGKVYYAVNTKEIIGFDFKNLCIFFKNGERLSLYEDYVKPKKEYNELIAKKDEKQYNFLSNLHYSFGNSCKFSESVIDRLKNDYGCIHYGAGMSLPIISKPLSRINSLYKSNSAFKEIENPIVQEIKDILQEEIDEHNKQIDIDNIEIDRQNEEWKTNKIKAQNIMKELALQFKISN